MPATITPFPIERTRPSQRAEQFSSEVLCQAIEHQPEFSTRALEAVGQYAEKVILYTGDLNPGEKPRRALVDLQTLISAATHQRYTAVLRCGVLVLTFDGNWKYHVYLPEGMSDGLRKATVSAIEAELAVNTTIAEQASHEFQRHLSEALSRP